MPTIIDSKDAAARLPELLERARSGSEQIVLIEHGKLAVKLVPSTEQWRGQESPVEDETEADRWRVEDAFRLMEEQGLITRPTPGANRTFFRDQPLTRIEGEPLSETIIRERGER